MKHGGQWRDFGRQVGASHRPGQDLWTVVSIGTFIESKVCTKRDDVFRTVERMDKTQPVLVSYLGQPAHINTPLGDGAWDGE